MPSLVNCISNFLKTWQDNNRSMFSPSPTRRPADVSVLISVQCPALLLCPAHLGCNPELGRGFNKMSNNSCYLTQMCELFSFNIYSDDTSEIMACNCKCPLFSFQANCSHYLEDKISIQRNVTIMSCGETGLMLCSQRGNILTSRLEAQTIIITQYPPLFPPTQ